MDNVPLQHRQTVSAIVKDVKAVDKPHQRLQYYLFAGFVLGQVTLIVGIVIIPKTITGGVILILLATFSLLILLVYGIYRLICWSITRDNMIQDRIDRHTANRQIEARMASHGTYLAIEVGQRNNNRPIPGVYQ